MTFDIESKNRRVSFAALSYSPVHKGRPVYWSSYVRYRAGRRICSVPFGIVWQGR